MDTNALQFFFDRREMRFPLFLEAVKFFNHRDHMVRTTVRTLTLSVCKVRLLFFVLFFFSFSFLFFSFLFFSFLFFHFLNLI